MKNPYTLIVEDCLGQRFPLSRCDWLCIRMGELDYTDPYALVFPDGETIVAFAADPGFTLYDVNDNVVEPDEIDWDLTEDDLPKTSDTGTKLLVIETCQFFEIEVPIETDDDVFLASEECLQECAGRILNGTTDLEIERVYKTFNPDTLEWHP